MSVDTTTQQPTPTPAPRFKKTVLQRRHWAFALLLVSVGLGTSQAPFFGPTINADQAQKTFGQSQVQASANRENPPTNSKLLGENLADATQQARNEASAKLAATTHRAENASRPTKIHPENVDSFGSVLNTPKENSGDTTSFASDGDGISDNAFNQDIDDIVALSTENGPYNYEIYLASNNFIPNYDEGSGTIPSEQDSPSKGLIHIVQSDADGWVADLGSPSGPSKEESTGERIESTSTPPLARGSTDADALNPPLALSEKDNTPETQTPVDQSLEEQVLEELTLELALNDTMDDPEQQKHLPTVKVSESNSVILFGLGISCLIFIGKQNRRLDA